jgi:glycosyltransferase involved in cell wall biosynthesis
MNKILQRYKVHSLIKRSGLFDAEYYLLNNPDVRRADVNPLMHFVKVGWKEGRNPSAFFDISYYLQSNLDIQEAGVNPLYHYLKFGWHEGRNPSKLFDGNKYIEAYPDVRLSKQNPLFHFLQWGKSQGYASFPVDEIAETPQTQSAKEEAFDIDQYLSYLEEHAPVIDTVKIADRKKISVIVTAFNHEKFIEQCLESILLQKGNFNVEIIVGDDCSTDNTITILEEYRYKFPQLIDILPNIANLGITKNLKRCFEACKGDYIAICEGDDYWIDQYKLQKQMDRLEKDPDLSMCFSPIILFFEDTQRFEPFTKPKKSEKETITSKDLIDFNVIGNFSCCMYRSSTINKLPEGIFDLYAVDWMINISCGEIGDIGYLEDYMSVYRKHKSGAWTGLPEYRRSIRLMQLIDDYDKLLSLRFHNDFLRIKELIINEIEETKGLLILDTIFPLSLSAFRYQEFTSLLESFGNSVVLTTGEDLNALREYRLLEEVIKEFEIVHPDLAGRTVATSHDISPNVGYLAYVVFQHNMMIFLTALEKSQIPFIFTLYPGGNFEVDVPESDSVLRRIFSSPFFRKVIVTQKLTYDYLIRKNLCNPDQIEFIYGVVTPLEMLEKPIVKKYYGVDKRTLDICFVAHKYMAKGIDKGYDVFIEVAKNIIKLYDDVNFHVVGSFDETDIPIEGLEGRVTFYGLKNSKWLCEFYQNQDVILSPNIPFVVHNGSFDGFPTASCTEAGANGVVILCTDSLELNVKFTDWEDIVLIPHDSEKITEIIGRLRADPGKLSEISKNGARKIREVYSYENQIAPRIYLIQEQLDKEKARQISNKR